MSSLQSSRWAVNISSLTPRYNLPLLYRTPSMQHPDSVGAELEAVVEEAKEHVGADLDEGPQQ